MEINHLDQKMLKPFDDMLRCRICSEFFNYCVMTACSHNFCSACLKKRMETESDCCICYEEIQESELRSNRSMDKIVRIYKKLIKTNATQSPEPRLQIPNNSQRNSNILNSSVTQATSQTRNCLPIQISSTETVPVQIVPTVHNPNPQSQSSTSFTITPTGTVPVQSTPSQNLQQPSVTFPVVLLQRIQSTVLPKTSTAKDHDIFDDFEEIENCSFTDDSNDSED